MVLNRTWRPQLAVIGMDGYPAPGDAGNVLLPYSTAKLSLRTPPTLDAEAAVQALKQTLEADPPYGARGHVRGLGGPRAAGTRRRSRRGSRRRWREASQEAFGKPRGLHGRRRHRSPSWACWARSSRPRSSSSPACSGPHSNAHGPNEFLHIPTGKRVTMATARLIAAHHGRA